jgi:hypothetical protein
MNTLTMEQLDDLMTNVMCSEARDQSILYDCKGLTIITHDELKSLIHAVREVEGLRASVKEWENTGWDELRAQRNRLIAERDLLTRKLQAAIGGLRKIIQPHHRTGDDYAIAQQTLKTIEEMK